MTDPSSSWASKAILKLTSLSMLDGGWCSDGVKPNTKAISEANKILAELILQDVRPKRIAPMVDGGIAFVFRTKPPLTIIVPNDGEPFLKEMSEGLLSITDISESLRSKIVMYVSSKMNDKGVEEEK